MSTHLNYNKSRDITVFKRFEDTKGDNRKRTNGKTIMHKTFHRNLNIEQHELLNRK
jgi:hypothetical protein